MADTRRKNIEWHVPDPQGQVQVDRAQLAVLMDLRDKLGGISSILHSMLPEISRKLTRISRNTHKPRKRRKK